MKRNVKNRWAKPLAVLASAGILSALTSGLTQGVYAATQHSTKGSSGKQTH